MYFKTIIKCDIKNIMTNKNDNYDYVKLFSYLDDLNLCANTELANKYKEIIEYRFEHFIPAVRFDSALFLYQLSLIKQPQNILEIGFGSGVSTYFINKPLAASPKVFITLEKDESRYKRGIDVLKAFDMENVTLLNEDAFEYLKNCREKFDYIFLDAGKKDYLAYLPIIDNLMSQGGFLICDNTFFNGKVALNEEDLTKSYAKSVPLLKEFNTNLAKSSLYNTSYFWIGDGMSLSVRK